MVPVKPAMILIPATLMLELMLQLLVPLPLKVAVSLVPGAVVSLLPPLVVDQLASEAKEPPAEPIQYLVAACACMGSASRKNVTKKAHRKIGCFMTRKTDVLLMVEEYIEEPPPATWALFKSKTAKK